MEKLLKWTVQEQHFISAKRFSCILSDVNLSPIVQIELSFNVTSHENL